MFLSLGADIRFQKYDKESDVFEFEVKHIWNVLLFLNDKERMDFLKAPYSRDAYERGANLNFVIHLQTDVPRLMIGPGETPFKRWRKNPPTRARDVIHAIGLYIAPKPVGASDKEYLNNGWADIVEVLTGYHFDLTPEVWERGRAFLGPSMGLEAIEEEPDDVSSEELNGLNI